MCPKTRAEREGAHKNKNKMSLQSVFESLTPADVILVSYAVNTNCEFSQGMFCYPKTDIDGNVMSSIEAINGIRASAEDQSVVDKWAGGLVMKHDEKVIQLAHVYDSNFIVGDKIDSLVGKRIAAIVRVVLE